MSSTQQPFDDDGIQSESSQRDSVPDTTDELVEESYPWGVVGKSRVRWKGNEGLIFRTFDHEINYTAPPLTHVWRQPSPNSSRFEMFWAGPLDSLRSLEAVGSEFRTTSSQASGSRLDRAIAELLEHAVTLNSKGWSIGLLHPANVMVGFGKETKVVLVDLGFTFPSDETHPPDWVRQHSPEKCLLGNVLPIDQQMAEPSTHSHRPEDDGRVLARLIASLLTGEVTSSLDPVRSSSRVWQLLSSASKNGMLPTILRDQLRANPPTGFVRQPGKGPGSGKWIAIGAVVLLIAGAGVLIGTGVVNNPFKKTESGPGPVEDASIAKLDDAEKKFNVATAPEQVPILKEVHSIPVPKDPKKKEEFEERRDRLRERFLSEWLARVELVLAQGSDPGERIETASRLDQLRLELETVRKELPAPPTSILEKEKQCLDYVTELVGQLR